MMAKAHYCSIVHVQKRGSSSHVPFFRELYSLGT